MFIHLISTCRYVSVVNESTHEDFNAKEVNEVTGNVIFRAFSSNV